MLNSVIKEFGQRMDMADLCLDEQRTLSLNVENIGLLQLDYDENSERLFVCLSQPYPAYERDVPRKILELCGQKHEFEFRAGIVSDMAVLIVVINARTMQVAELENGIQYLANQMANLFAN